MLPEFDNKPKSFDDLILPKRITDILKTQRLGLQNHFLFYGDAGTGKSATSKLLPLTMGANRICVDISDSDERSSVTGFDKLREFILQKSSSKMLKYIIIDEADNLSTKYLDLLKNFYDKYSDRFVYIFTTNYIHKFKSPILDRMVEIDFTPKQDEFIPEDKNEKGLYLTSCIKIKETLLKYDVPVDKSHNPEIGRYVKSYFPHYRSMFNNINLVVEHYRLTNEINLRIGNKINYAEVANKIFSYIKTNDWTGFRNFYANNPSPRVIDTILEVFKLIENDEKFSLKEILYIQTLVAHYTNNSSNSNTGHIQLSAFVADIISSRLQS